MKLEKLSWTPSYFFISSGKLISHENEKPISIKVKSYTKLLKEKRNKKHKTSQKTTKACQKDMLTKVVTYVSK